MGTGLEPRMTYEHTWRKPLMMGLALELYVEYGFAGTNLHTTGILPNVGGLAQAGDSRTVLEHLGVVDHKSNSTGG